MIGTFQRSFTSAVKGDGGDTNRFDLCLQFAVEVARQGSILSDTISLPEIKVLYRGNQKNHYLLVQRATPEMY